MPHSSDKAAPATAVSTKDKLLTLPQYLLPQHTLSKLVHRLCRCRWSWLKNAMIKTIIKQYQVDMSLSVQQDITAFEHFNAFFTRALRQDVRQLANSDLVSPVDGKISQIGDIKAGRIIQAKGQDYSVAELLGNDMTMAQQFTDGQFATIYLSPRDYHRIHMPCAGRLQHMRYVPGKLFSVNPRTVQAVPRVFARNERLVTVFETGFGPIAVILVGAIFVGSMQTVWHDGEITPPYGKQIRDWQYQTDNIQLAKGAEMGRFNMGSTVVLLLPKGGPAWQQVLTAGNVVKMGAALSQLN
ncbi:MAG: archaetidylserine decarboxylase [Methylophaga sp.]|nr:archaetidylserine decarboxylase [Methylophaga sp.]